MKIVGIIGGLGPETTAQFYLELIFSCQKLNQEHRPEILIASVPLPYDIEKDAITRGRDTERCLPFIIAAAKKLEIAGADFLVMPCNSLHAFIAEIRRAVKIPVLNIVEETVKFLKTKNIPAVGILATAITINKDIYSAAFKTSNIAHVVPNNQQQIRLGAIIHNLVTNKQSPKDREELVNIINDFETRGINHVMLACTDLQLLLPAHPRLQICDTMKILAAGAVQKIL